MAKHSTKKQHYIPRMILKRHTFFFIPMAKPLIYQYDLENDIQRIVDTKDICRKKNLYEFRMETGEIDELSRNLIENNLSKIEGKFEVALNKVENNESLTEEDIVFITYATALQILRTPDVMGFAKEFVEKAFTSQNKLVSIQEIDIYSKFASFPVNGFKEEENVLLWKVFRKLWDMNLVFLTSYDIFLINGNNPVLLKIKEYTIIFPVSSYMCLMFTSDKNISNLDKITITSDETKKINHRSVMNKGGFVCSSVPLHNVKGFDEAKFILDRFPHSK